MTLWTPADLASKAAWWDFTDLANLTKDGSNNVTAVTDKTGAGVNLSGTGGVYSATAMGSTPGATFSGQQMTVAGPPTAAWGWAVVVKPTATSGGTGFRGLVATSGATGSLLLTNVGSTGFWGTFASTNRVSTSTLASGSAYILVMDGTTSGSFWTNGSGAGSYAATTGQAPGHVGGLVGSGQGVNAVVAEIIGFSTAVSTADRQRLEGYLAHKHGLTGSLPGDHPYISSAPLAPADGAAAITEADDTVAATAVTVDQGSATLTEAADTVLAEGLLPISADATMTEGGDSLAGLGDLTLIGLAALTEDSDGLGTDAGPTIVADAAPAEGSDTLRAHSIITGLVIVPTSRGALSIAASSRGTLTLNPI